MQNPKSHFIPGSLLLYIPLWLFFVYLYAQILQFRAEESNNLFLSGLYFIEFGIHEVSHLIVSFLPSILVAAAGSTGEVSFTLLLTFAAFKARVYFAGVFTLLWVMLAMNSAGRYMADARTQSLPLVGPGENPLHDWNYVFGQLGWLNADALIGGAVRGIGDLIGLIALIFGLWLLVKKTMNSTFNKK